MVVEQFAKAAMDLSCEAQLMAGLDHAHICKLRGWTNGGPSVYSDGKTTSFFLILDRLAETLQARIGKWREDYKAEQQEQQRKQRQQNRNSILEDGLKGMTLT